MFVSAAILRSAASAALGTSSCYGFPPKKSVPQRRPISNIMRLAPMFPIFFPREGSKISPFRSFHGPQQARVGTKVFLAGCLGPWDLLNREYDWGPCAASVANVKRWRCARLQGRRRPIGLLVGWVRPWTSFGLCGIPTRGESDPRPLLHINELVTTTSARSRGDRASTCWRKLFEEARKFDCQAPDAGMRLLRNSPRTPLLRQRAVRSTFLVTEGCLAA